MTDKETIAALLAALTRLVDSDPSNAEVYDYDIAFARAAIAAATKPTQE